MKILIVVSFFIMMASCSGGRKPISERPIATSPSTEPATQIAIREIPDNSPRQEFYVKKNDLNIKRKFKPKETGSLTSTTDPRSFVRPATLPREVGSVIEVKTSSNKLEGSGADSAKSKGGQSGKADDKNSAKVEEELLKSLPSLDPADGPNKPELIKSFKAKVIEIRENGDAVVAYHRRSLREDQASDLLVNAVIPHNALVDRENIKTTDLQDVKVTESRDGEITERISGNWEDEYTLRMSGFDEAKSKSAVALDEKYKQLKEARERVIAQVKSLGQERTTMAKERSDLLETKAKDQDKIASLESKVKEQEEAIKDLTPEPEKKEIDDAELAKAETDSAKKDPKEAKAKDAKTSGAKSGKPNTKPEPSKSVAKSASKPAGATAK